MSFALHYLDRTDSTNNYLKRLLQDQGSESLPDLMTVYTFYQTAGRGQAGNSWESEEGKNLLFTTLLKPRGVKPTEQFRITEVVALAVYETVRALIPESMPELSEAVAVKWPNDIYVFDKKLSGILIENILEGSEIVSSIIGVGLNLNQEVFLSPAPNPVSLSQLTGLTYDLHATMQLFLSSLSSLLPLLDKPQELHERYMSRLYRRQGMYEYMEREVSVVPTAVARSGEGESFMASVVDVDEFGRLVLLTSDHEERTYHFKQLRFVI